MLSIINHNGKWFFDLKPRWKSYLAKTLLQNREKKKMMLFFWFGFNLDSFDKSFRFFIRICFDLLNSFSFLLLALLQPVKNNLRNTVVEHTPCDQEFMGLNPVGSLPFFLFTYPSQFEFPSFAPERRGISFLTKANIVIFLSL